MFRSYRSSAAAPAGHPWLLLSALLLATGAAAQPFDPESLALSALRERAAEAGLSAADLADVEVTAAYRTRHNGVYHVYLRQRLAGLPIVNAVANVNILQDGRISSAHQRFAADAAAQANLRAPQLAAAEALNRFATAKNIALAVPPLPKSTLDPENQVFTGGSLSRDDIPVELVYYNDAGRLRLAWSVVVRAQLSADWWNAWIDAADGRLLDESNWTAEAGYRVFAAPNESPLDGGRTLETDPADPTASPLGWHDTGLIGGSFTDTRGNNVQAQDDFDANNIGGSRPDGGAVLNFDFPLDLTTQQPPDYIDFAVTNLFYWNNTVHDVMYRYGFDEAAGNFQQNNFGLGGSGNDAVRADAQDGSGTNNANFGTPPDGSPGRMQMFVWTGGLPAILRITAPPAIAGDFTAAPAGFGAPIDGIGTSGSLQLVDDGSANPTLGCGPLVGFTPGNIAVVDRGTCEFGAKGVNAQTAGASAMIVVNNAPGNETIPMGAGAQGGNVTIPAAMIGNDDGNTIKAELTGGVSGTLLDPNTAVPDRDSDLDAGVIAHEYGHGVSTRLTGGPNNSNCLFGDEQQGEGWSDFQALFFTAKAGDTADQPRGVGRYLIFADGQPAAGIRPFPYSRDMGVNPETYGLIVNAGQPGAILSVPHGVGTVWTSALWDMYWNLVDLFGFDPDLQNGNGGNNLAMQLVVDGMKLQPCGPTFVTSRDAILEADMIDNGGANACAIWEAFARRGVGFSASDGGGPNTLNVTEAFDLPAACQVDEIHKDSFEDPAP